MYVASMRVLQVGWTGGADGVLAARAGGRLARLMVVVVEGGLGSGDFDGIPDYPTRRPVPPSRLGATPPPRRLPCVAPI